MNEFTNSLYNSCFMDRHCEEPRRSFQTLEGRSSIGYYTALFHGVTYTFSLYDQPRPPCISSVDVGMTMVRENTLGLSLHHLSKRLH